MLASSPKEGLTGNPSLERRRGQAGERGALDRSQEKWKITKEVVGGEERQKLKAITSLKKHEEKRCGKNAEHGRKRQRNQTKEEEKGTDWVIDAAGEEPDQSYREERNKERSTGREGVTVGPLRREKEKVGGKKDMVGGLLEG